MECDINRTRYSKVLFKDLASIAEAVIRQRLHGALIARAGLDQHIAAAECWNRPVGIIDIVSGRAIGTVRGQAAISCQIELLQNGARRRPAIRMLPIIGDIMSLVGDPRSGRIKNRRLIHNPRMLAPEPMIKPFEVRIARPETGFIDEVVVIRSNPQTLVANTAVEMRKGRYHARLENVEPRRDMETGDIYASAKIMPRAKLVRRRVVENFIEMGLHN